MGVSTIRAFADEGRFTALNEKAIDGNLRAYLLLQTGNRWLTVRTEALAAVVIGTTAFAAVVACGGGGGGGAGPGGAGLYGLAVSYALQASRTIPIITALFHPPLPSLCVCD